MARRALAEDFRAGRKRGELAQRVVAFVTGVAVGAIATYPYYDDCWAYEPVYDAYGNYLGQQYVNLCLP